MATSDDVLAAVNRLQTDLLTLVRQAQNGEPAEPGKRLTLSDVLRSHLDAMQNRGGGSSSVTLSRNAKGDAQFEVTVRAGDSPGIDTAADAHSEAVRIFDALSLTYKRGGDA